MIAQSPEPEAHIEMSYRWNCCRNETDSERKNVGVASPNKKLATKSVLDCSVGVFETTILFGMIHVPL